ncbi:MAG: hypothetical protein ACFFCM_10135 [Promethearchaeota archaeon]
MDISELIKQIEEIYNKFMISDNTPDMEADLKIKLLEAISSTLAFCNLRTGPNSENLKTKLNDLKDKLLIWDPFGPWFKENKELSKSAYDAITLAKTLKFEDEVPPSIFLKIEDFNAFKNTIQSEMQILKNEINTIKDSIKQSKIIKPTSVPVSGLAPKPIPIPKPVPVAQPVSKPEPVPIPKPIPVSKPTEIPTPVPLTDLPASSVEEIKHVRPELDSVLTDKKIDEEKDTSKLFGLFSKPVPEPVQVIPEKPSPSGFKSVTPIPIPKPTLEPVPVQPTLVKPTTMKSIVPKLIPIKPVEISVPELDAIVPEPIEVPESDDPEALYHELISLQGKRYGLERSIKDLKALHQSGSITENEYKQKLSSKLNDLKKISAKIERIREKLD